jgi:hypothetical protein
MTFLARVRRGLQKISPYLSLVLLLIPLLLVEPLKLVALVVVGKGHWLTGTGMLVVAYAASLLVVERLFRVVKPKLMMMDWFAKSWAGFVALRNKFLGGWSGKGNVVEEPSRAQGRAKECQIFGGNPSDPSWIVYAPTFSPGARASEPVKASEPERKASEPERTP